MYGIGYIGDGIYKARFNNKYTKEYILWTAMLQRCYDPKFHIKCPTYIGCQVHSEWWDFQEFAKWYNNNYINGFELDKDILFKNNKIYSSQTCCFVPKEINSLFIKSNKIRGIYPIGVRKKKDKKRFSSQIKINGKLQDLGYYDTIDEAFLAYKKAKELNICNMAKFWKDKINSKTYNAMINYKVEIDD